MQNFSSIVCRYINEQRLLEPGEPVLIAFSGGADSCALLHLLSSLRRQGLLENPIFAAHINHNLRGGDSYEDEKFAAAFARDLAVEYISQSADVESYAKKNSISIELAARQVRREILSQIAASLSCGKIATAHHKDDNAETLIHRLSRGTGLKGLSGIWAKTSFQSAGNALTYIRPLLCVRRVQIEQYCRQNNINWRHDKTNDQIIYTRNLIRHQILPELQSDSSQDLSEMLNRLAKSCQNLYNRLEAAANELWREVVYICEDDCIVIDSQKLNQAHELLKQQILRMAYWRIGGSEAKITRHHYNELLELAKQPESSKLQLPCEIYCFGGYGKLIFQKISDKGLALTEIDAAGEYRFRQYRIIFSQQPYREQEFRSFLKNKTAFQEFFDADKLKLPIKVRCRENGDRFVPIGLNSEQKIGKFLIGAKIDHRQRQNAVVFEDAAGKIIWLAPYRASEQAKIDKNTQKIYKIQLIPI